MAALAVALAAYALARADGPLGDALGPDRVLAPYRKGKRYDADAADAARRALRDRPIDGASYRVLAHQAQVEGDGARALALLATALARGPRDIPARAMAADTALRAGDPATAWVHLDALMRVEPETANTVLASVAPTLELPAARDALVARLRLNPPWRTALPTAVRAEGLPWAALDAFWSELGRVGELTPNEVAAHAHALEQLGRPGDARARWIESLGNVPAGLVFDGGFDLPDVTGPYAWSRPDTPGVELAYERAGTEGALVARFDGRAVRFAGPAQLLALPAGRYDLATRVDNRTSTARPFEWRIDCVGGGPRIAKLELPATGSDVVHAVFEVPTGCQQQRLELRHNARYVGEQVVSGSLHLLDVGILPTRVNDSGR